MMNRCVLLVVVMMMAAEGRAQSASEPAATQPAQWETSELGQTLIVPMQHAPFPHASRENGLTTKDGVISYAGHYDDPSVALFVPRGFTPRPGGVDLLFYFHGHGIDIRRAMVDYRLREQVVACRRNIILVFPEGPKDVGDSCGGKLEEPGALKRLTDETLEVLVQQKVIPTAKLGRVLMAGHSGAYRIMFFSVEHGGLGRQLLDLCLLDSCYAKLDALSDWLQRQPDARLFSIFTDHLAPENVTVMTRLRRFKRPYLLISETDLTEDLIRQHNLVFAHTDRLDHSQVVQWMERWLRAARLPRIGP